MKKNNVKIIAYLLITLHTANSIKAGFSGFTAAQDQASTRQAVNNQLRQGIATATSNTSTTNTTTNCPTSNNTATTPIMPFGIQICGSNGQPIMTTHQFNVPSTFTIQTAILTVHIFPASNSINGSTITYATGQAEGTYIIYYTIKDPAGSICYKEFDTVQLNALPHIINLIPQAPASTAPATSTTTTSSFVTSTNPFGQSVIAFSNFLPTLTSFTPSQKQQIINGISPISQKFFITQNNSQTTIIPISGTFDGDSSQSASSITMGINSLNAATATSGNTIGSIGVCLTGPNNTDTSQPTIVFEQATNVQFNQTDLASGILMNIIIFPSQSGDNYPVVATLRSTDGLKMRKKTTMSASTPNNLSFIPTTVTIQYTAPGGSQATNVLTTSFLNSATTSTAFNAIAPTKISLIIIQPTGSQNMTVLLT